MQRRFLVPAVAVMCALVPALVSAQRSPGRIDQSSPVDLAAPFTLAVGGGSGQQLAQVVTVGLPPLKAINLAIGCSHEDPGAELTLSIVGVDESGRPNATVLAMERFPVTDLPDVVDGRLVALDITPPLGLRPGTQYAFVLQSNGSCGLLPGPVGDPYAGGDAYFDAAPNPPGWLPISIGTDRYDLGFQTVRIR